MESKKYTTKKIATLFILPLVLLFSLPAEKTYGQCFTCDNVLDVAGASGSGNVSAGCVPAPAGSNFGCQGYRINGTTTPTILPGATIYYKTGNGGSCATGGMSSVYVEIDGDCAPPPPGVGEVSTSGGFNGTLVIPSTATQIIIYVCRSSGGGNPNLCEITLCGVDVDATVLTPESCLGANDGAISAVGALEGMVVGTLTYSIDGVGGSTANTTGLFTGLAPGDYTITVYDSGNTSCVGTAEVTILASSACCTLPTITLSASPIICQSDLVANLAYSATTDSPDQYSIDFDGAAEAQGFSDLGFTALPGSPIVLTVPGSAVEGTYNATITVRNTGTGCTSDPVPFTITIQGPEIEVTCTSTTNVVADEDASPTVAECTDFGCLDVSSGMLEYEFTITNSGPCPLILNGTPLVLISGVNAGDFTVTQQPTTPVAASGGTTTFKIKFDPNATGLRTATVIIANNDNDENLYNFSIEGFGNDMTASIDVVENSGTPNDGIICASTNVDLTASPTDGTGPYTYAWSPNIGADEGPHTVAPVSTTTYTVTITDANGCTATSSQTITVSPGPTCSITTFSTTVCANSVGNYYEAPAGMASYAWSVTGDYVGNGATNGQSFTVDAAASGSYTVTVIIEDGNGCTTTCSEIIDIELVELTLTASSPISVATCGDMVAIEIRVSNSFTDLSSLQYSVNWDETQLQYVSHTGLQIGGVGGDPIIGTGDVVNGNLTYSWFDPSGFDGEDLADATVILTLNMKVIGNSGTASVDVSDTPLNSEVVNKELCDNNANFANNVNIALSPITITLDPIAAICPGVTTASLPYTATTGSPDEYKITFDAAALLAGFANVTYAALPGSPISIVVPADITCGVYNATLMVRNSTTGCESDAYNIVVTVEDNMAPTITTCPVTRNIEGCDVSAITGPVYSASLANSSEGEFEDATNNGAASDVCGITEVTYIDVASGTCPIVVTRTWTVQDACGNETSCEQTINVDDDTAPAITQCPQTRNIEGCDLSAVTGPAYSAVSAASSEAEFENGTNQGNASDACGITEVRYIDVVTPDQACPIIITRTWTVKDACGNMNTCEQTINVDDTTMPTITTCPQTRNVEGCDANAITSPAYSTVSATSSEAEFEDATNNGAASDVCGITEVTYIDVASGTCPIVVTRTWTVRDACGNETSCEQTINVDDDTAPAITQCPQTRNIEGCDLSAVTGPAYSAVSAASSEAEFENGTNQGDASDACGITEVRYIDVVAADQACPIIIFRTWTVKDACGNMNTCDQTINVDDTTMPMITTCPQTRNVEGCDANAITSPAYSTVSATSSEAEFENGTNQGDASDACGITEVTYIDAASSTCPIVVTRTWTVRDACGNETSCEQTINVDDTTPPTVGTPNTQDLECSTAIPAAAVDITEFLALSGASASDVCTATANLTVTSSTGTLQGNNCNGTIDREYMITDECGNTTTVTQTFTVTDNTNPNATAPTGSDLECSTAIPDAVTTITDFINLPGAGASDNCTTQANLVVSHVDQALAGTECNGTIDREYMITDECGNTTTVTQVFTVTDNTPPDMVLNGPDPIELCQGAVYVDPGVTATDNCSGDVTGTVTTMGSVDINTLGDYVVTYTATDDCGNTATISRTFSVNPGFTVSGVVTNVLCHGESTGEIDLTVTGGALPLVFNWGGPAVVVADEDQINLPAGTFLVTVTDANGCAVEEEFGITEPTELQVSMSGFLPETCAGANDGSAIATASGGVGPYEFKWSNLFMQTHPSASTAMNLAPDNYLVTVTDANGCSKVEGL